MGQPAVRLARAAAAALPLVGERLERTLELFDLARIDHFRGFVAYWAVPAGARNAIGASGRGPGRALFDAIERELGTDLPLVAEDLGVITPAVERLRESVGLPGMLVHPVRLRPRRPTSPHRLANHVAHRVVYTGTHDYDTARGWSSRCPPSAARSSTPSFGGSGFAERRPWWGLIRMAHSSPAVLAMIQAQDVLGLGSEARMNDPASAGGSWRWQMKRGALTPALARRLREITEEAGRLPA